MSSRARVPPKDDEPTAQQKRDQTERILASRLFQRALKPAELLRFIVECDLDGKPFDESRLGIAVFGRQERWIPLEDAIVRENIRRVRKLLDQYYAGFGSEDRLRLAVLAGYKPSFTHNHLSRFEQFYRRALRYVNTNPKMAFSLLRSAHRMDPNHSGVFAASAETRVWQLLCGNDMPVPEILSEAEDAAQTALRMDSKHWRAHLVLGAIYCCRREWESAAAEFSSALDNSREETSDHPWYAAFLMAAANPREALQLVKARADENSTDDWAQLTYALFLYVAREFKEAQRVLGEIQGMGGRLWLADVMWFCVNLALGERESSVVDLRRSPRLPDGELAYPALFLLSRMKEPPLDDPWNQWFRNFWQERYPSDMAEARDDRVTLTPHRQSPFDSAEDFQTKSILEESARDALARWEAPEETPNDSGAVEISEDGSQIIYSDTNADFPGPFITPCHLALGYMAVGETQRALALLRKDFDRNHPLLVWLNLWPVLDPLREHGDFKALVRRMALERRQRRT